MAVAAAALRRVATIRRSLYNVTAAATTTVPRMCSSSASSSSSIPEANNDGTSPSTHFGFRNVPLSEKQPLVSSVFSRVASSYDLMNDILSLGTHRLWKDQFVSELSLDHMTPIDRPLCILDCAGGTGDIAFRLLKSLSSLSHSSSSPGVIVCDVNAEMLQKGRERAKAQNIGEERLRFMEGNAENLPFPNASFDVYTISFGMRNVPRAEVALDEALRVLRPGGRFLMLEFGQIVEGTATSPLRMLYETYSMHVIPRIGGIVANDVDAYKYLVESIRQFPKQKQFLNMMKRAGFTECSVKDYSLGIAACYSGFKPPTREENAHGESKPET